MEMELPRAIGWLSAISGDPAFTLGVAPARDVGASKRDLSFSIEWTAIKGDWARAGRPSLRQRQTGLASLPPARPVPSLEPGSHAVLT